MNSHSFAEKDATKMCNICKRFLPVDKDNWHNNTQCKQCHNIMERNRGRNKRGQLINGKEQRVCVVCGVDRGLECFTKNPTRKDCLNYICDYCNDSMLNQKDPTKYLEHTIGILPKKDAVTTSSDVKKSNSTNQAIENQYIATFEQHGTNTYSRSLDRAVNAHNAYYHKINMHEPYSTYLSLEANHVNFFKKVAFDTKPGTFHKLPEQVKVFFQQCMEDRQYEEDIDPLDTSINRCFYCGAAITHKLTNGQYMCERHKKLRVCQQCKKAYPIQWFGKPSENSGKIQTIHIGCESENIDLQNFAATDFNSNGLVPYSNIKYTELKKVVLSLNESGVLENNIKHVCVKGPVLYNEFIATIEGLPEDKQFELPNDVIDFYNYALGEEDESIVDEDTDESNQIAGWTTTDAEAATTTETKRITEETQTKKATPSQKTVKFEDEPAVLKQLLRDNSISQNEAARSINIDMQGLNAKLNNRRAMGDRVGLALYEFIKDRVGDIPYRIERYEEDSSIEPDNQNIKKSNSDLCHCEKCNCLMPYTQYKYNNHICDVCLKEVEKQTVKKHWDGSYMTMFEQSGAPYYFKVLREAWVAFENIKGRKYTSTSIRKMIAAKYNCRVHNSREMMATTLVYGIIYDIPKEVALPKVLHDFFIMYILDRIQEEVDPFDITIERCKYCGMPATDINNLNKAERTCDSHKDVRTCTTCNTLYVPRWGGSPIFCPTCRPRSKTNDSLLNMGFTVSKKSGNKYHLHSKHPSIPDSDIVGDRQSANELLRCLARECAINKLNRIVSYEEPKLLEIEHKEKQPNNIQDKYAAEAQAVNKLVKTITELGANADLFSTEESINNTNTDTKGPVVCMESENIAIVKKEVMLPTKDGIKTFIDITKEAAKAYMLNSASADDKPHRITRILALKIWQELEAAELELEKEVPIVTRTETHNEDSVNFYMNELALSKEEAINLSLANTLAANSTYLRQ